MMGGHYATVFDATAAGWNTWPPILFGLLFLVLGLVMLRRPQLFKRSGKPAPRRLAIFFMGFSALWTACVGYATWHEYARVMDAAAGGTLKTVEGKVEKFVPMPSSGHALEHFCVKDACFSYSDYVVTTGFNHTSSHGGPVHADLPVRVTYLDGGGTGNIIVKLEVEK
jgi:hypothetical protein